MARGLTWQQWNPGLHHGERKLGEVKSTLPATPPDGIPGIVKVFENPASPWASPGAITLDRHDCVHILLGRGLSSEDEAFVIGFTNGAATTVENNQTKILRALSWVRNPLADPEQRDRKIRDWQYRVYMYAAKHLYKPPFRFSDTDIQAFQMGFAYGERLPVRDLQNVAFEEMQNLTVAEIRKMLGIDVHRLESIYAFERNVLHTRTASRLDYDEDLDTSDITPPDAPDSDWVREKKPILKSMSTIKRWTNRIRPQVKKNNRTK